MVASSASIKMFVVPGVVVIDGVVVVVAVIVENILIIATFAFFGPAGRPPASLPAG